MSLHHTLTPAPGYDISHGGYYILTLERLRQLHTDGAITLFSINEGGPQTIATFFGMFGAKHTQPLDVPLCGQCDQPLDNMNCADCCIAYVPAGLAVAA